MLALLALLAGCGPGSDRAAPLPAPYGGTGESGDLGAGARLPDRISGPVLPTTSGAVPGAIVRGGGTPLLPPGSAPAVSSGGPVSFEFVDADIREITRYILADVLKVNFTIDAEVQGTATLQTSRPLVDGAVLAALQTLLLQNNATLIYENGLYRAASANLLIGAMPYAGAAVGGGISGGAVVELRYASATRLVAAMEPFLGETTRVTPAAGRNALVVTGVGPARESILSLIRALDTDLLTRQAYALYPVKPGDATSIALDLQELLQTEENGAYAEIVRVIAIERADAVLIVSPQQRYVTWAVDLLDQMGRLYDATRRRVHLFYARNTQAAELQPVLQRIFAPQAGGQGGQLGAVTPAGDTTRLGGSDSGIAGGASTGGSSLRATRSAGGLLGQPAGVASAQGVPVDGDQEPGGGAGGIGSPSQAAVGGGGPPGAIQIVADPKRNALLVFATNSEYALIEAAIQRLDVLPMQVLIEATIAEVTLNDQLQYGTQFFFQQNGFQAALSNITSQIIGAGQSGGLPAGAGLFPGIAIGRTTGSAQFIIQALQQITDVVVVSSPQVLILENERGRLQVGDLVPILTQTSTSVISPDAPIVSNIEYRETGVILTVVPRVNAGGLVTLEIEQEVSDVVQTTSSTIDSPTFQQRKIRSRVVVQDGETIALAGLIRDNSARGSSGVPVLQSIPVLGWLFGTKTNARARTELIVLLTPRVVHDQRDARALTEELQRKLAPGSLFPTQPRSQAPAPGGPTQLIRNGR